MGELDIRFNLRLFILGGEAYPASSQCSRVIIGALQRASRVKAPLQIDRNLARSFARIVLILNPNFSFESIMAILPILSPY